MARNTNASAPRTLTLDHSAAVQLYKAQRFGANFFFLGHGAHSALATRGGEVENGACRIVGLLFVLLVMGVGLHFLFVLTIVVGSDVVGGIALEHLVDNLENCTEPETANNLQRKEESEKIVAERGVPANGAVAVVVRFQEISPRVISAVSDKVGGVGHGDELCGC